MSQTPLSQITIFDVPLSNRYEHTYYFETRAAQVAFFSSKKVKSYDLYTYLRRNMEIKVQASIYAANKWKYLSIRNRAAANSTDATAKEFYYFINSVEYVNENTVKLAIEMDVLQTYLFDINFKPCFIERTHTATDEIGEHTLDEGLECGELVNAHLYDVEGLQEMCIMILSAVAIKADASAADAAAVYGGNYCNTFSGLRLYAVDLARWQELRTILSHYSSIGKIDGIVAMWMYPKSLVKISSSYNQDWMAGEAVKGISSNYGNLDYTLAPYENYDDKLFQGYKPKNNKLYCYPYNFLYLTNNMGGHSEMRYERMRKIDGKYGFITYGALSPEAGVRWYPAYYNDDDGYEYGLEISGYPSCAWNADSYQIWLAQNYHTLNAQGASAGLSAGAGILAGVASLATGNLIGAGAGAVGAIQGLTQIQGLIAQNRDMQSQPAQARGAHSSSVNVAAHHQTFTAVYKTVSAEYAKTIDNYFTMYGYKVNIIATPNLNARERFTFIKTVGCIIDGDFGHEDKGKICEIFDSGVTWWKPDSAGNNTIGQYFTSNSPNGG